MQEFVLSVLAVFGLGESSEKQHDIVLYYTVLY